MRSNYFASTDRLGSCSYESITNDGSCYGSLARRSVFVEKVRSEKANVLLVDSGDMEAGGINLDVAQGEFIRDMYSSDFLGYDFVNLGPRDFDGGNETLLNLVNGTYKVVASNLIIQPGSPWDGKIVKSGFKNFGGTKVGVISVSSEKLAEEGTLVNGISFIQEEIALEISKAVTELAFEGIDIIILLSKSTNYTVDEYYIQKIPSIDVVVGSYKGFYFKNGEDKIFDTVIGPYPRVVNRTSGIPALILSAPSYGVGIGQLDLTFTSGNIDDFSGDSYYLDDTTLVDPLSSSKAADIYVVGEDTFNAIDLLGSDVIAKSANDIIGTNEACRSGECEGGSLVADSIRFVSGTQIAMINGGAIRATIQKGDVTLGETINMFPFKNTIATFRMSGEGIVEILTHGLSGLKTSNLTAAFIHVSGMRFTWNPANTVNESITGAEIATPSGEYEKLTREGIYTIATADFLFNGGDAFNFKKHATDEIFGGKDVLASMITFIQNKTLNLANEGRIVKNDGKFIFQETIKNARLDYQTPVGVVTLVLMSFPIVISIIMYIKRQHAVVVISSPFFCHLISLGCIICYLGLVLHVFIKHDAGCMLIVWLGAIGFSIMYGCLFAKTWRIHSIFSRQKKMKITKKPINNIQLFTVLGLMLSVDVVLMAIWQGVSPLKNEIKPTDDHLVFNQTCSSKNGLYFFIALLVYKALLLVWGMYLVFLTRHVDSDFRESTFIGFIIYAVFLTLAIVVIVGFIIKSNYVVVFFLTCLGFWLVNNATILALFIPKLIEIFSQPDLLWESYFKRRAANLSNKSKDSSVIGRNTVNPEGHSSYYSVYSSSDGQLKKDLKTMKNKQKESLLKEFESKIKSLRSDLSASEKQLKLVQLSLNEEKESKKVVSESNSSTEEDEEE